jgi:hypothetical protein
MGPAEVAAWGMLGFIWEILGHVTCKPFKEVPFPSRQQPHELSHRTLHQPLVYKSGFADAAVYRVGFRLGAGQPHNAKIAAYKAIYLGMVGAALSTSGLFVISGYIPGWLTPDPTLQRMIFDCLPLVRHWHDHTVLVFTC